MIADGYTAPYYRRAIARIEDEAARKERERIAAAVEAIGNAGWCDVHGVPSVDVPDVLAAITDTGEEAAP
jgi:hypothetical protein